MKSPLDQFDLSPRPTGISTAHLGAEHSPAPLQPATSTQHSEPVLLTIGEVAAALRMNEKSVRRRIKSGVIRKAPTGGRLVRISSEELRRLIDPPSIRNQVLGQG